MHFRNLILEIWNNADQDIHEHSLVLIVFSLSLILFSISSLTIFADVKQDIKLRYLRYF